MKRDTLTKTERRIVKAWEAAEGCAIKAAPEWIRGKVRRTAFHEAGHVAAHIFTGQESGHILHVSIIPEGDSDGRERSERNITEFALAAFPPPMKRSAGRCLLLGLLAGRGAEARIADPEEREDILDENALWMEGEQEGTDLYRALRVADIMARPGMPARRVLALAEKWTVEMLALPDVWRCVEALARMLFVRGTIEAVEIMPACEPILDMGAKLPRWRRRLTVAKVEVEAMKNNTGRTRRKGKHDEDNHGHATRANVLGAGTVAAWGDPGRHGDTRQRRKGGAADDAHRPQRARQRRRDSEIAEGETKRLTRKARFCTLWA